MRGSIQNALRLFTRAMRPLALRSAGEEGSSTSVVRHVGRRSGRTYETPVIAVQHDDSFLIALPYGKRTDWLKNVLDRGLATIVTNGHTYEVDRPEVILMAEATAYFRPREQRMHRQFHVDSALRHLSWPITKTSTSGWSATASYNEGSGTASLPNTVISPASATAAAALVHGTDRPGHLTILAWIRRMCCQAGRRRGARGPSAGARMRAGREMPRYHARNIRSSVRK